MMEGIFICAAPHCFKSFLKKTEFESHVHENHADLLHPNTEKDGNELEAVSAKQSTALDSTARAPPRPVFSPNSSSQVHDCEDKARRAQPGRPVIPPKPAAPPLFGQIQNHQSEPQPDNNHPPGYDTPDTQNRFPQHSFDTQGGMQLESGQSLDKLPGVPSETPFADYPPMHGHQPPNFAAVPINSNPALVHPPFSYPPFPPAGAQPFYGSPYEIPRPDSAPEAAAEQGSLLGFPPVPAGGMNFPEGFPRPWNVGPTSAAPSGPSLTGQGSVDGFSAMSDPQRRTLFFQGDYGLNAAGVLAPSSGNKVMEPAQGGNAMDTREGRGMLAPPQPLSFPPPPPPHLSQHKRDKFYSGDMGRNGQGGFGWQQEKHDSFGRGQD